MIIAGAVCDIVHLPVSLNNPDMPMLPMRTPNFAMLALSSTCTLKVVVRVHVLEF